MSWKSEFKEQLQLLEGNPLTGGDEALLLCYALENQIIPEDQYMAWAQKQTLRARIAPVFFSERPAPVHLFQKFREKMPWSKALLPVGEWDGHLLVAGILVPENLPKDVLFFFAAPQSLMKYYDAFFGQSSPGIGEHTMAQVQASKPVPSFEGSLEIAPSSSVSPELVLIDGEAFEPEASPTEDSILSEQPADDRLDLNFDSGPSVSLDFTSLSATAPSDSVQIQDLESESTQPPPVDEIKFEDSAIIAAPPEVKAVPTEIKAVPAEVKTVSNAVKATPTVVPDTPVSENSVVLQTPTGIKGKNQVGYYLSQWNTKTLSSTFKDAFEKMKTHFDRCLILSLSDDDQKAKVLFWDSLFQEPQQDFPVQLRNSSIFYIAAKTAKPFHGPISINEENEKFFECWNRGKIPAHTTLIPIIVQDQVIALLMGIGESSAYNRATLHFAEKMGTKISENLKAAKAA